MSDKKIVIVGGGLGGLQLARNLVKKTANTKVTVVDPREYMEVPFGQLRSLVDPNFGSTIRKNYRDFVTGVEFVQDSAVGVEAGQLKLGSGDSLEYDYLVLATGSSFPEWTYLKGSETSIDARQKSTEAEHSKFEAANSVLIIGGGPIGVELAGELADRWPEKSVRIVEGSDRILSAFSMKMTARATKILEKMGVEITTGTILSETDGKYRDSEGKTYEADLVVKAVGIRTNTAWLEGSGIIPRNERGAVKVNRYFQVEGQKNIFAIGDITDIPEMKVGAIARMHADKLAGTIASLLKKPGASLKEYKPMGPLGLVTLGSKAGAVQLPFGHPHFMIKMKQKDLFAGMYLKKNG